MIVNTQNLIPIQQRVKRERKTSYCWKKNLKMKDTTRTQTEGNLLRQKLKFLPLNKQHKFFVSNASCLKHQNSLLSTKNYIRQKLFNAIKVCHVLFCLVL